MSNAIAQSATMLTLSGQSEEAFDFDACAKRASDKNVKADGMTRERASLGRQKLIEYCKNDYRMHFAAIYGKTDRIPSVVFEKIEASVDKVIAARLGEVNAMNAVSYRRGFAFKANDLCFVDRITVIGENTLALKEQHLACNIAIRVANQRLDDLYKKKSPDLDREKSVKAMLMKLEVAKNFIEGEIAHQDKVSAEVRAQ